MRQLQEMLIDEFPVRDSNGLAYLPWGRPFCQGLLRAEVFTIHEVSLERCGCTGGWVAAVTGELRQFEKTSAGPVCTSGPARDTLRLEFESRVECDDADVWALKLRERTLRDYKAVVALEVSPELQVRMNPAFLEACAA